MSVTKIQLRRDTATNWSTNNPTLDAGELGIDTTNSLIKLGNGTSAWNSLSGYGTTSPTFTGTVTLPLTTAGYVTTTSGGLISSVATIPNAGLTNSSITVNGSSISLGGSATVKASTTNALTIGTGLSGTSFDGGSAVTIANSGVLTVNGSSGAISNIAVTNANNSFSAQQSANSFVPTSSTAPTNGLFLPATNSLGFSTNSVEGLRIDANGDLVNITSATLTSANMRYGDGTTTYANIQGNYLSGTTGSLVLQTLKAGTLTTALTLGTDSSLTLNGTQYQSAGFVKTSAAGLLSVDTSSYITGSAPTINNLTLTGTLTAGGSAGTSGYVLQSTGTGVQWAAASGSTSSPTFTGTVTLPTSTSTVAPLILPTGTVLTTPAAGVIESDGTTPYITESTTLGRSIIDTSHMATTGIYSATLQNIITAQPLWGGYTNPSGTLGTPTGTGPWTVVITALATTGGFIPGKTITVTAGTGTFNTNTVTIVSVDSATQITVSATGGTIPTAGTVTNVKINTTGALTLAANTTYIFEQMLYLTTGVTSHQTSLGFSGTVGVSSVWFQTDSGLTAVSGTIQASGTSGLSTVAFTTLAGGLIEAATTAANTAWRTKGIIRTTTSGTLIPQITFSAAPGAPNSMSPTSFFRITPIGSSSFYTVGAWA